MKYPQFPGRRAMAAALCVLFSAAFASAQVSGVPNFQKINDHLYRGGQPSREGFQNLAGLGVKLVLDLRNVGEHSQAEEESWVKTDGMSYVSIPMRQLSAPRDAEVSKSLAILDNPAGGAIFVHCRRGADRTGTVIACYRIEHDHWDNHKALEEARGYGMSRFERAMQNYILRFNPEAAAEAATQQ